MQNNVELASGENTTTSTSTSRTTAITMKPPPSYRTNLTAWFRQMETQVASAGIINDTTEYHHFLAAMSENVATNLPMEIEVYSSLKESITQVY